MDVLTKLEMFSIGNEYLDKGHLCGISASFEWTFLLWYSSKGDERCTPDADQYVEGPFSVHLVYTPVVFGENYGCFIFLSLLSSPN